MIDPQNIKGWKPIKQIKNIESFKEYHERNFVRPHKGKDAGTDFFDVWKNSTTRIYDLFQSSNIWKNRKHKRKVSKPEMTTEDNYLYCGCGCWFAVNLPPYEKKEMFKHHVNLYSLILLFEKFRNL